MAKKKDQESHLTDTDILNEKLDKMLEAGMEKTREWVSLWQQSLRYFFGDQLHGKRKHKDWDWVIINYIWPSSIQEIAKLSKNHPKIIVNPWETGDSDAAETWQSILQWLWEKGLNKHGMRLEQIAAILEGKLFGYRVSKIFWEEKVGWDDKDKKWVGDVKHKLWHPARFWVSPDAETLGEAEGCGTMRYVNLDWAIHRWPEHEEKLKEQAIRYGDTSADDYGGLGGPGIRGQLSGDPYTIGTGGSDKGTGEGWFNHILNLIFGSENMGQGKKDDTQIVKITEIYFKDYEETTEKLEEDIPREELLASGIISEREGIFYAPATNKPLEVEDWPKRLVKKWKEPKYPKGRYVLRAGKLILNPKEEEQKYPHSRWPFIVTPHYLLPHMWQGLDATSMSSSMQDMINITASHLVNNMKLFGDPKIAVEDEALATNPRTKKHFRIGAGAGAVIRLVRGGLARFKILDPVPLSPGILALYQLFTQEYKNISGLQSIARGEQQKNMTATEAQHLAISANDRIALQSVYEDEWIKQIVSLVAEISQMNYGLGRIVRIVGEDKLTGAVEISRQLSSVRFDTDIEPGTTLPYDEEKRLVRYTQAFQIVQQPIANPMTPEMLRMLEISNWKKILDKYEAWQQFYEFFQLYEAVKTGQVEPQAAMQAIMKRIFQIYNKEQEETVPMTGAGAEESGRKEREG